MTAEDDDALIRKARKVWNESEERFRAVVRLIDDAIIFLDQRGRVMFWNPAAVRLFGYHQREILDRPIEVLFPDAGEFPRLRLLDPINVPPPPPEESRRVIALTGRRQDGSRVPVEATSAPWVPEGGISYVILVVRDVSVVRRLERRYRELLEAAPDAVVICDRAGAIRIVNGRTEEMFGYARSEMIGQKVEMLLPEDFMVSHVRLRDEFFAVPRVHPMAGRGPLRARHKTGREFPVEINLSPVHEEDGLLVYAAVREKIAPTSS